jgi:hypothetical protein
MEAAVPLHERPVPPSALEPDLKRIGWVMQKRLPKCHFRLPCLYRPNQDKRPSDMEVSEAVNSELADRTNDATLEVRRHMGLPK